MQEHQATEAMPPIPDVREAARQFVLRKMTESQAEGWLADNDLQVDDGQASNVARVLHHLNDPDIDANLFCMRFNCHPEAVSAWTKDDQESAQAQGWGIFIEGNHRVLQRLDEAGVFASDEDAMAHVALQGFLDPVGLEGRAVNALETFARTGGVGSYLGFMRLFDTAHSRLIPVKGQAMFVHCANWSHCFAGSRQSVVRWLFSITAHKVIFAQEFDGAEWRDLTADLCDDICDSLVGANELPEAADDFLHVHTTEGPPHWLPKPWLNLMRSGGATATTSSAPA